MDRSDADCTKGRIQRVFCIGNRWFCDGISSVEGRIPTENGVLVTGRCRGGMMESVQNGQCGLCSHFGETHDHNMDMLVSIRTSHQADLKILDECGHPKHAGLHLKVTAISGCDGFSPAVAA